MAHLTIIRFVRTILFLIIVCLISVPTYAKYSGGTGEPNDPYQIATAEDLMLLGETPDDYDKHFILTADIDLDPNLPGRKVFDKAIIAPDTNDVKREFQGTPFIGVFDGNGYTISHPKITGQRYLGLFGGLGGGKAEVNVRNLGVVDVNIAGEDYVGGLVGISYHASVVAQCYSTGSVSGMGYIGGLLGENHGRVTQCYSTAAVRGARSSSGIDGGVGGLVGENFGVLADCYNIGSVRCHSPNSNYRVESTAGGLVGMNGMFAYRGVVTNCFWDIETSGQPTSNGGMGLTTGEMQNARTFLAWGTCGKEGIWNIDDDRDYPRLCWQNIPGEPIAVGATLSMLLAGEGTEDSPYLIYTPEDLNLIGLFQCDWDKHFKLMEDIDMSGFNGKDGKPQFNVIAPGRLHGFEELFFQGVPFTGLFDGNDHTISCLTIKTEECGGMFGGLGAKGKVRDLRITDVNITGSGWTVGGLVGWNECAVTGCFTTGVVRGSSNVGALVGTNWRGNVTQCHSICTINGSYVVGGLVGFNKYGSLNQCYSAGRVDGELTVGGLVGASQRDSSVTQCYSTVRVSGQANVGGLVGANDWDSVVNQCYGIGPVSGESFVGGLVGYNGGDVIESFWDIQTSAQTASAGGASKTTDEMQTASTYIEAGWDFVGETENGTEDIWWILEGKDYPRLWWELIPEN